MDDRKQQEPVYVVTLSTPLYQYANFLIKSRMMEGPVEEIHILSAMKQAVDQAFILPEAPSDTAPVETIKEVDDEPQNG